MSEGEEASSPPKRTLSFPNFHGVHNFTDAVESDSDAEGFATPSVRETISRNLSMRSLAEADLRAFLWKPQSYRARGKPRNLDQLIAWTIRGGCRGFFLAYGWFPHIMISLAIWVARAGFNLVLLALTLLRARRRTSFKKQLLHALFGPTPVRFGLLLGCFTAVYRWTYHGLRICNFGPQGPGKQERWHAATAGAIASLALLAERPAARSGVAQQAFVRALQGVYHRLARQGLHIPQGDTLLFALSCGQIMSSWIARPELLDATYNAWITTASRMPPAIAHMQRPRLYGQPWDIALAEKTFNWPVIRTTQRNAMHRALDRARLGQFGNVVWVWIELIRWIFPIYAGLNLVPPLIFRWKIVRINFFEYFKRAMMGSVQSSTFLACFLAIFQGLICSQRWMYYTFLSLRLPSAARLAAHRYWLWGIGFCAGLSLLIEQKKRREELALYVLPKALTAVARALKLKGLHLPNGELLFNAVGIALIADAWQHERSALSKLVRTILWQTIG